MGKLLILEGNFAAGQSLMMGPNGKVRAIDASLGSAGAYPRRSATPKIAGAANGTALTTLAVTASRQYFIPFVVSRDVALTALRFNVTSLLAGAGSVGIYSNTTSAGDDTPGTLLASVSGQD